jgi:galactoside 2-L-fucosyltransferase 1/2
MQWFRKNIPGPLIFLIVSDDVEWCRKHLLDEKVKDVVIASKSPSHDLALLATSAHNIIDYGSYGLWGAFMTSGHTITLDVFDKIFHKEMTECSDKWHTYDIKEFL